MTQTVKSLVRHMIVSVGKSLYPPIVYFAVSKWWDGLLVKPHLPAVVLVDPSSSHSVLAGDTPCS